NLVRIFAPDVARAYNLSAPQGLVEGVAVYRESRYEDGAGRLNAPLFTMKMRAAMLSDDPWSLTQMMEPPAYTQPFNRFYIGGAHAFKAWTERGDHPNAAFFRDATALHSQFPFLGFGVGLWTGLGQWPGALDDELRSAFQAQYQREMERRAPFTDTEVVAGETGHNYRRPYWVSADSVVTYLHGYDVRRGFYRVHAETGERSLVRVQSSTEDYTYALSRDTSALYASRYVPDPWVPTQEVAEVERVDLSDGEATRLTENGRAFAPVEAPNGDLWAVQNDGAFSQWARLDGPDVQPLTQFEEARFKQIAPSPNGHTVAVLLNVEGTQRIYRIDHHRRDDVRLQPWLGLREAIIYDLCWGPEGRYLLFSADLSDAVNIFAFDPPRPPARQVQAEGDDAPDSDESRPYQAWRHLAPRMVYPTVRYDPDEADRPTAQRIKKLGVGVGVGVAGNDPLGRWRYEGDAYLQDGRLWGAATVQSGRWRLRPSLTVFNTPETVPVALEDSPQSARVGLEERGVSLDTRLPIRLQSNVYQSAAALSLGAEYRQTRFFGDPLAAETTPWRDRVTLSPRAVWGHRVQQNPRDLVPNQGLILNTSAEIDVWTDDISPSQAFIGTADVYLPLALRTHTGVRLGAGLLTQNQEAVIGTSQFVPRGYEDVALGSGSFLRVGAEVTQPLWYIDDGSTLIPFYAKALYGYGFGQTMTALGDEGASYSSVGAGIGLEFRFFYALDFDVQIGAAFRLGPEDIDLVWR
ncbi:MAG: hypothetical protein BRD27_02760, partial [Bacteroidetes bacterium QH_10_64_19]